MVARDHSPSVVAALLPTCRLLQKPRPSYIIYAYKYPQENVHATVSKDVCRSFCGQS
jgi:hypothetical protein